MIDIEKIDKKIKPLNDRIRELDIKFGKEISNELLERIEVTLNSFFEDFKEISSKSFSYYWEKQRKLKDNSFFNSSDQHEADKDIESNELTNTPKFISEYKKKGDKK